MMHIDIAVRPEPPGGVGAVWREVVLDFPAGPMPVLLEGDGAVLSGLRFGTAGDHAAWLAGADHAPDGFVGAVAQLQAYAAGELFDFDLRLRLAGTAFQTAVWTALQEVPYGRTVTYGHLAGRIGRPGSARAVGAAVGANPVGIIVPCHRVVGSDGSLTGFAGGVDRKIALLAREGVTAL